MARKKGIIDKSLDTITQANRVEIGFISMDDESTRLVDFVLPRLDSWLERQFPDHRWKLDLIEQKGEDSAGRANIYYFEAAHDVLIRRSLDFAVTVSSDELKVDGEARVSSMVSRSLSSAIIPTTYIGAPGGAVSRMMEREEDATILSARFQNLFLHLLGLLIGLGESADESSAMKNMDAGAVPDDELFFSDSEIKQMEAALDKITGRRSLKIAPEVGKFFLYLKVLLLRPGRILMKALRNKPWRLLGKLHKLVFPAVVAVPLALFAQEFWDLGTNIDLGRAFAIAAAIVIGVTIFIVWKQKLLMRMPPGGPSEEVAVFNLSSVLSIVIAVVLLIAVIFVITLAITTGVFPRKIVSVWLGVGQVNFGAYAKASMFIACLASLVGWMGAGFTESDEFRLMLYTNNR